MVRGKDSNNYGDLLGLKTYFVLGQRIHGKITFHRIIFFVMQNLCSLQALL